MQEGKDNAFDPRMWGYRASEYSNLGWVQYPDLIERMVSLADLNGDETVIDAGMGSGAITRALAENLPNGHVFGFDISEEMLQKIGKVSANVTLFQADVCDTGLPDEAADVITMRMVLHHVEDIEAAVRESWRVLKPSGRFLISEYVVLTKEVQDFERRVFDIKEPGRHLWTPEGLREEVLQYLPQAKIHQELQVMPQYSVKDWMEKSGLPTQTQLAVLECYLNAPPEVVEKMRINYVDYNGSSGRDALVDRPFTHIVAVKPV